MVDITVPIPDDRTAEFYQFFGMWLAGSLDTSSASASTVKTSSGAIGDDSPPLLPWGSGERDYADAEKLWRKYSTPARAMFSLMIDHPDQHFTGDQIADAIEIPHGARGVAGALAWPGRHGIKIGRGLPTEYGRDQETGEGYYWIPADRAEVFKRAREKVEGKA